MENKKTKNSHFKWQTYKQLNQTMAKPWRNAKAALPLGAAFLAGAPFADAAFVTGTLNINVIEGGGNQNVNLDGGGNDFVFRCINTGTGPDLEAFAVSCPGAMGHKGIASVVPGFFLPSAINSGAVISGAVVEGTGFKNSFANDRYTVGQWRTLPAGATRFFGFKLDSGNYGWIRITKNTGSNDNWTLVDYAYEDSGQPILAGEGTLPLVLSQFNVKASDKNASLHWATASETNNAGFEVERSDDGKNYGSIAWVEGAGNSREKREYFFDDKNLREGKTYYYRLKQVAYNGSFEYSDIRSVRMGKEGSFAGEFFPNPSNFGFVELDFTGAEAEEATVIVYDQSGREILVQQKRVEKGNQKLSFDFTALESGVYYIKIQTTSDRIYRKLAIAR